MSLLNTLFDLKKILITNQLDPQEGTSQCLKYIEVTEKLAKISVFPYGKYRGKQLERVLEFDREWFVRRMNSPSTYPDLRYAMQTVFDELDNKLK
jgi:hypothetical protein